MSEMSASSGKSAGDAGYAKTGGSASGAGSVGSASPLRVPLPPAGPAWFPTVMGSGILSTLIVLLWGESAVGLGVATVLAVVAWLLLFGLCAGFGRECRRERGAALAALREASQRPAWGTVSMGVMSVGSATSAVLPAWSESLTAGALWVDAVLWTAGTVLGLLVAVDFAAGLVARVRSERARRRGPLGLEPGGSGGLGKPTPVWGLTVVAPMVASTAGCTFIPHVGYAAKVVLLAVVIACFVLALALGALVFTAAYYHHWRRASLPLALTPSLWIPLGVVGQSTAAIQLIAARGSELLPAGARPGVLHAAHIYGIVVLGVIGAVLGAYAAAMTFAGFARRMPFSAGWWSLTFPIGTCALGAFYLGQAHGSAGWHGASGVITGVLACTWTLCSVASVTAVALTRRAN